MNLLSAISKLVATGFKKPRHKRPLLLLVIAVVLNYLYLLHGNVPDWQAWYDVFYAILLIDTLILSVLMAVLTSQLVNVGHKGNVWNLLPMLENRALVYLNKLPYGLIRLVLLYLLQMGMVILVEDRLGYEGNILFSLTRTTFTAESVSGTIVYQF